MTKKKRTWDPMDWQGRRREQVEGNYKVLGVTVAVLALVLLISVVCGVFGVEL